MIPQRNRPPASATDAVKSYREPSISYDCYVNKVYGGFESWLSGVLTNAL